MQTIAEKAEGILALRHVKATRQEHKPSKYDAAAKPFSVRIDAKLQEMADDKQLRDEIGG